MSEKRTEVLLRLARSGVQFPENELLQADKRIIKTLVKKGLMRAFYSKDIDGTVYRVK